MFPVHPFTLTILTITICMLTVSPAYAYIDMGTGSMVFQMLVAGMVGAAFTIKMYWHALKAKIRHLLGKPSTDLPVSKDDTHDSADNHSDAKN